MPTTREIVKRRKSVANIRKITRTMEMIATARFKRAHDSALGARPYTENIMHLLAYLAAGGEEFDHPLLEENNQSKRSIVLVMTGNRGLCGGYNGNVVRLAHQVIEKLEKKKQQVELRVSGKKGVQYFKFVGRPPQVGYTNFDEKTSFKDVEGLADEFMDLYINKKIDSVHVVYTSFASASRFFPESLPLLPLTSLEVEELEALAKIHIHDYIFTPSAREILEKLLPYAVRMQLYQCFKDSIASEQVARMRAMKAATDNAEHMIKVLSRHYNRARQSQITSELLDIQGGVEALK